MRTSPAIVLSKIRTTHSSFFKAVYSSAFLRRMMRNPKTVSATVSYVALLFILAQNSATRLVPSQEVDELLHQHMNEPQFALDCLALLGTAEFVHSSGCENATALVVTRKQLAEQFGIVYTQAAACEIFIRGGGRA